MPTNRYQFRSIHSALEVLPSSRLSAGRSVCVFFFVRGCIRVGACWRDLERSGQVRKRQDGQGKL
jgi:hypothetical protein